jgi:pyridoxamine 5'-phosphate oxidase
VRHLVARLRYAATVLREADFPSNPLELFQRWLAEAMPDPSVEQSMTLATATPDGRPSARVVLLKSIDERGLVFYTSYQSRKGRELEANPVAAIAIHWPELHRQVRVEGRVERVTPEESDAYFRTRPLASRISALASPQSEVIADRSVLEGRVQALVERFRHDREPVPRPASWGGYRIVPEVLEFWQAGQHRLHDRIRYRRDADGAWIIERLAP